MPDLRAKVPHRGTGRRFDHLTTADRAPDRVAHHQRPVTRADGVAVSTAVLAVGAALAWWEPAAGSLRSFGLALVVLGPLALIATLTLLPPADGREQADDPGGGEAQPPTPRLPIPTIDERLPELALEHSVRPGRADPTD